MRYAIGIDGGGTKTTYALADETGRLLLKLRNGCTNHDLSGMDQTVKRLTTGIRSLVERAGIEMARVKHVHIALAGMDTDEDKKKLEAALAATFLQAIPHTIENDLWIAFFAQARETYGAISICGTGHNTGVLLKNGKRVCIQANRYPLGNIGGGRMLCDMALNAAYMSYEKTGESTLLEDVVPACCGCGTLRELARRVMDSQYTYQYGFPLPQLLEEAADKGDRVACKILAETGKKQADMTGHLMTHMGMHDEPIPVVLAGSIYCKGTNQELVNAYRRTLRGYCPDAHVMILDRDPVEGAVLCALRSLYGSLSQEEDLWMVTRLQNHMPEEMEAEYNGQNISRAAGKNAGVF